MPTVEELEQAVNALRIRVALLEGGAGGASQKGGDLAVLQEIRDAILIDRAESQALVTKYVELQAENERLKQSVAKLTYRVAHILKN